MGAKRQHRSSSQNSVIDLTMEDEGKNEPTGMPSAQKEGQPAIETGQHTSTEANKSCTIEERGIVIDLTSPEKVTPRDSHLSFVELTNAKGSKARPSRLGKAWNAQNTPSTWPVGTTSEDREAKGCNSGDPGLWACSSTNKSSHVWSSDNNSRSNEIGLNEENTFPEGVVWVIGGRRAGGGRVRGLKEVIGETKPTLYVCMAYDVDIVWVSRHLAPSTGLIWVQKVRKGIRGVFLGTKWQK